MVPVDRRYQNAARKRSGCERGRQAAEREEEGVSVDANCGGWDCFMRRTMAGGEWKVAVAVSERQGGASPLRFPSCLVCACAWSCMAA